MKKTIFTICVLLALGVLVYIFQDRLPWREKATPPGAADFKEVTFLISGKAYKLTNGLSEIEAAPGSASKIITRYFGNEIYKDLDGDGTTDVAFLVIQETGGSGVFYYLVGALNKGGKYVGTQAVYIGDRIAPQSTTSGPGRQIIVNYADRKPGEPMTAHPSVGKSLYLLLDPTDLQFGEVVQPPLEK